MTETLSPSSIPETATANQPNGKPATDTLGICHVSMCLATGGLERLLVEFARRVDSSRYRQQFAALGDIGGPAEEIAALGCPVHGLTESVGDGKWARVRQLARILREQQIQIVHTHNTYAHFYGTIAAKLAGVPTVINTQHGRGCGSHWKQRAHFFLANRMTRRVLAVSEDSARICRQQDLCSRNKIEPLWNGIDLSRFSYHGPARKPHAISVARLSPEKDFPTLLHAVRQVVDRIPEFRLTIVGDGNERQRLEELTSQLQLTEQVTFLGERSDVPDLLREAGLFVSATSTEGISLTLLEAMAVGLPIITTRVGGNPEVVDDGVTGHLVPPADPTSLAEAICDHLQQPDTWEAMGTLSRSRVEQQFDINRMIHDYEHLYDGYANRP